MTLTTINRPIFTFCISLHSSVTAAASVQILYAVGRIKY